MLQCIYCRETKPMSGFGKVEHVMPQSFGRFEHNMTLRGVVCDECNQFFADNLELYLGRDTPDGFNRFRLGVRPAADYRSLGKRSEMKFRIDSGPLAGVQGVQRVVDDELLVQPLPQVGFENPETKEIKWYLRAALPDRDQLRALVESGHCSVHLCEVVDPEAVLKELEALGVQHEGVVTTRAPGRLDNARIEISARLEDRFGRAVTKVSLNYFAYIFGAEAALLPAFDQARQYARYGAAPDSRIWSLDDTPIVVNAPRLLGHVLTAGWIPDDRALVGQVSFHCFARYQVRLADHGFDGERFSARGHYFDIPTKAIVELKTAP